MGIVVDVPKIYLRRRRSFIFRIEKEKWNESLKWWNKQPGICWSPTGLHYSIILISSVLLAFFVFLGHTETYRDWHWHRNGRRTEPFSQLYDFNLHGKRIRRVQTCRDLQRVAFPLCCASRFTYACTASTTNNRYPRHEWLMKVQKTYGATRSHPYWFRCWAAEKERWSERKRQRKQKKK